MSFPAESNARRAKPASRNAFGRLKRPARARALVLTVGCVGFGGPVVAYLWFIHLYGANAVFQDQWSDVELLRTYYSGTLGLSALWNPHGDHRTFFPNLAVILQARVTHLNIAFEEFVSAVLLIASVGLIIWAHRRRSSATPWIHYSPVVILMLSFVQFENALWGYQLAWYMMLLAFACALVLLDRPKLTVTTVVLAMAMAIIGSFSLLQGLLIWPVGLLVLWLRRRRRSLLAGWIGVALVTGAVYYYHFSPTSSSHPGYVVTHPLAGLEYLVLAVGSVLGVQFPNPAVIGFGVIVLALAVWTIAFYGLRRNDSGPAPIGAAVTFFGLLFVVLITQGRTSTGVWIPSRYSTFALLILVGIYLTLLGRQRDLRPGAGRNGTQQWAKGALVGVILLQVVFGTSSGIINGRAWHQRQLVAADVTANLARAPDGLVGAAVVNLVYGPRQLLPVLQDHGLALFGTADARRYEAEGLFPSLSSVRVTIIQPKHGEVLSGTQLIVASAVDPSGLKGVEFRLTGKGRRDVLIATAHASDYVWIARWDTTGVSDGRYVLECVAYAATGSRRGSANLPVIVRNG